MNEILVTESKDIPSGPLSSYWMEEVFTGEPVIWDGKKFSGGIRPPDFFVDDLPEVPVAGFLWVSRKENFRDFVGEKDPAKWKRVRFIIQSLPGSKKVPYERLENLLEGIWRSSCNPYLMVLHRDKVQDSLSVERKLKKVKSNGGNAVRLRPSEITAEEEAPPVVVDDRPFIIEEAVVVGHKEGHGKHKGKLGGLVLQLGDGRNFNVGHGLTDRIRTHPPEIGTTVIYKYLEVTENFLPKCAFFVEIKGAKSSLVIEKS